MASSLDYVQYICEQIKGVGEIRFRKMFGEYLVYVNDKPIFLVCDNTVFVKMIDCLNEKMKDADTGIPYEGSKLHYIVDIDNSEFSKEIAKILEEVTPIPKKKKVNKKN